MQTLGSSDPNGIVFCAGGDPAALSRIMPLL
jgi:hypothetical protein